MPAKKSSKKSIARRYASALFAYAKEKDALADIERDFLNISKAMDASDIFGFVIKSPIIPRESLADAMEALQKELEFSKITARFLRVLVKHRRLSILSHIIEAFKEQIARDRGEITAQVISAKALEKPQEKKITTVLAESTGKKINLDKKTDASILGGVIVKIGSQMLDGSIATALTQLEAAQKNITIQTKIT